MTGIPRDKQFAELLRRQEIGRRSDLFLCFRDNAVTFAQEVARQGGTRYVNWQAVADRLNEAGIVGRGGKPVTADMARKAWKRAQQEAPAPRPTVVPIPAPARPSVTAGGSGEAQTKRFVDRLAGEGLPIPRPITRGE